MLDDDGLPLDEVGAWAKEKHERLRKYVDITRSVRKKFIERSGGATYIDPYCGSGRSLIRDTQEKIDGSPLVAFKCAREGNTPFSEVHIADVSDESCRAAESRLCAAGATPAVYIGAAEQTVREIVERLNPHGLHFAFLDPYNLDDLPFTVIEAFSRLKRIDMLIHVSAQDLQRNLDAYTKLDDGRLERFAPGWRSRVDIHQSQRSIRAAVLAYEQGFTVSRILANCDMALGTLYYWLDGGPREEGAPLYPALTRRKQVVGKRRKPLTTSRVSLAARLWRTAECQARDIEERLARPAASAVERERDVRMLNVLVRTLRDLALFDAGGAPGEAAAEEAPLDIDEFRNELARRIRAFVASEQGSQPDDQRGAIGTS